MEKKEKKYKVIKMGNKKGQSIKVDYETYNKLQELKAKTHIPMAAIMRISVENFEKERGVK